MWKEDFYLNTHMYFEKWDAHCDGYKTYYIQGHEATQATY
jgi:hypothetical protein